MKKSKVSIIIPVYNAEKHLSRCIGSVLNQTYTQIELILLNDGSKDKSIDIIRKYEKKDKRIIVIDKQNEGVAKTRNLGIQKATGDYLMFIDNDDYIDPDYVETYLTTALKEKTDIVMGGYKRPNTNGKIIKNVKLKDGYLQKEMIYKICAPWAKIYKRNYIIQNKIEFLDNNLGEDIYFNLQALMISNKVTTIHYDGYNWFYNDESVSNTTQKKFEKVDVFRLLNECYKVVTEKNLLKKHFNYTEYFFYIYIIWFLCFSQRHYSYHQISQNYDKLFNWLKDKFPNYKKNEFIGFNKPKDENFIYKLFFFLFSIFNRFGNGKILIYLYTRL